MNPFINILNALGRITEFMLNHGLDLPEEVKAAIGQGSAQISPVDRIVHFGKAMHEHRDSVSNDAKIVGAEAIEFAGRHGWHGLETASAGMIADMIGEPE
jgi:hypothetical protein